MRIWDIHPGYLNQYSLLGEHRELHGLVSILVNKKKGYSQHPETLRWVGYGWAIKHRHKELVREMELRGYKDKSPVRTRTNHGKWPSTYIDKPHVQLSLLKEKYQHKEGGRIPLPRNEQELWSHHKYSILARDPKKYKEIGARVAIKGVSCEELALELVELLRVEPSEGGIRNALQHMWGYVSGVSNYRGNIETYSLKKLLMLIQKNVRKSNDPYLTNSTALSDLMVWL
ncbi:MAG: DUF1722 domain-containing protein [Colwellia sp.]|nr:DUF1722 domain-containing protein [Colwellia sp.]MCW8864605.1 DUF1722 domain-containing protein [Colwellia sp.]MCW9081529.1 DUF1722 domain-containing protein [Colwellia sp.]